MNRTYTTGEGAKFAWIFSKSSYSDAIAVGIYELPATLRNVIVTDQSTVSENAFIGCYMLKSVTYVNRITGIGANAFSGCTEIESITLSSSITSIGANAFSGWTNAQTIIFEGITQIELEEKNWYANFIQNNNAEIDCERFCARA